MGLRLREVSQKGAEPSQVALGLSMIEADSAAGVGHLEWDLILMEAYGDYSMPPSEATDWVWWSREAEDCTGLCWSVTRHQNSIIVATCVTIYKS